MNPSQTPRLDRLDSRLRSVWKREQALHFSTGLLTAVRWGIGLFVLCVAVDWLADLATPGRAALLLAVLAVPCFFALRSGWRQLRTFSALRTALKIERHHGNLTSLLVSAVQFREQAAQGTQPDHLRLNTCRLAEQAADSLRPEHTVPFDSLRRPATVSSAFVLAVVLLAMVNGSFLAAGVMRLFVPWSAVAYPTNTHIALDQQGLTIKEGDSAQINAQITGVIPDKARIAVRTGTGSAREITLDVDHDRCTYTIASASRDFTYRIKAGDARTPWHTVRVVPAPRIERVKVDLTYPPYLDTPPESVEALTLTLPEGTDVHWQLSLDRPVRSARFIRDGEEPMDLPVTGDGRVVTLNEKVAASRGYSFEWVEKEHGFDFASPRYYLQVASDQPPKVELTSPQGNLVAMLNRPLILTVRAQDDHGIGATRVTYRVNQHDEQTTQTQSPVASGEGDQPIDWDYRKALPDLEVGDTVSFNVEVSDRYPGEGGPHVARSETRRITFLSKDKYLEQVAKRQDRLLLRVQSIYRQQRSAHEAVRAFDPHQSDYTQACQLEAIRQELVREQLQETAVEFKALLDDLAANNIKDAVEFEPIDRMRAKLNDIADKPIAQAASLLRAQSGFVEGRSSDKRDPHPAAYAVNAAARELGGLVMLRSIDSAQEVYARECHMLALEQATLRLRTIDRGSNEEAQAVATLQDDLAQWTEGLANDLLRGMRYDKRPLAVLRLTRGVKDLRAAGTVGKMREAAALIRSGQTDQASALQDEQTRFLLNCEFSVRLSGAYTTLLDTTSKLKAMIEAQRQLRMSCQSAPAVELEKLKPAVVQGQAALRKQLFELMLPTVPAPRTRMFDDAFPEAPPVPALVSQAQSAMVKATQHLGEDQIEPAAAQQAQAEQALARVVEILERWSTELGLESQGMGTLVAASSERLSWLEKYETQAVNFLEKTDATAAEEKKVDSLVDVQQLLTDELVQFKKDLLKQYRDLADPDIPPLVSRLERAERSLTAALESLRNNKADEAIGLQETAADTVAEARELVVAQGGRLAMLQDLLMFKRSVGFANRYMSDIVAEQRDLIQATQTSTPKTAADLQPIFTNLRNCLVEVAPLLQLVAGRLDAGTPLAFANTDLEDAADSLKAGDKADALDAQDVAAESLGKVQQLVAAVQTQTGYVAEIVEYLHHAATEASMLEYQQDELRRRTEPAGEDQYSALAMQEADLAERASEYSQSLLLATGMTAFDRAGAQAGEAHNTLQSGDRDAAVEQMKGVVSVLNENIEAITAIITMLNGLPSIEVTPKTDPGVLRLIDVLALASDHKQLLREAHGCDPQALKALADRQAEIDSRCLEISHKGEEHPMLRAAQEHLAAAVAALTASDRETVLREQRGADEALRHFIIEQALILQTAKATSSGDDDVPTMFTESSDAEHEVTAGFVADFVSGEAPQDKRSEWNVLGQRNRAALNQNFARELPLEYRGLLKDYYERVAK
ncbi:MAG: hypothetical protein GC164_13265 [Phycisphaera sp.]|nr:hypothetical protein [Phycisphaera sp.]